MLRSPSSHIQKLYIDMGRHTKGHPKALKEEEEGSKIKCSSLIVQIVQRSILLLPTQNKRVAY